MFQRNLDYFIYFYENIKQDKPYKLICGNKEYIFLFDGHYFGSNDIGFLSGDSNHITNQFRSHYGIFSDSDLATILKQIPEISSYEIVIQEGGVDINIEIPNEDDRLAGYNYLDDYHESRSEDLSNGAQIKVGLEIERKNYLTRGQVKQLCKRKWRCERDGSVDGGEYITPVLDIDKAYSFIEESKFVLNGSDSSSSCGGHIHISHTGYNSFELYAGMRYYRPILWALYPSRSRNSYSSKDGDPEEHSVDVGIRDYTVEFRIFPILRSLKQVKFRLALLKFFVTNLCPSKNGVLKILNDKSLEFISILDIAYPTFAKKISILTRIMKAYELDDTKETEILEYLTKQCEVLNK